MKMQGETVENVLLSSGENAVDILFSMGHSGTILDHTRKMICFVLGKEVSL